MGLFSRMKDGIKSRANAAIDAAVDPAKELDLVILELEQGRKAALQELITYKATARQLQADLDRHAAEAQTWEQRAMTALRAGDEDAARQALRRKKDAEAEVAKITRDRDEAASYAISLNKSRKEFETKLAMLKLRKGTLATQLAAARGKGADVLGTDNETWERFARAEQRIDDEAAAAEVDAALGGDAEAADLDARILAASRDAPALPAGDAADDALAALKRKVAEQRAAKAGRALPGGDAPAGKAGGDGGGGPGGGQGGGTTGDGSGG